MHFITEFHPLLVVNLDMILVHLLPAEVAVIVLVEFAVGLTAIISGFGFRHTYIVSGDVYDRFLVSFMFS